MGHTVESIQVNDRQVASVTVRSQKTGKTWIETADHVVANVTVQDLIRLLGHSAPSGYKNRVDKLSRPSGAFVLYLGVETSAIPADCPPHLQFLYDANGPIGEHNSLFISVSHDGDGRAPAGKATIIASTFVDATAWRSLSPEDYQARKQDYTDRAISKLGGYFNLDGTIVCQVAGTPQTFAHFTAREDGIVGGIGMRLSTFGPFGFANRTPIQRLWLVGDSTHPGEGTAGVSYSALTVVRQITES
jgi:C-3',4' desaturase CrtD